MRGSASMSHAHHVGDDTMPVSKNMITVITSTYNRAPILGRLYASLVEQTFKNFEWLIVDDGSTDDTSRIVFDWQKHAPFKIRYSWQENQGKHVALNRAVEQSSGEFSAVIDSDDWYRPDALERLLFHWYSIRADQKPSFGNVEALCAYPSGSLIGTRFPKQVLDSDAFEVQYVHKVLGDKVGMYRTEVLRSYPFPENLGPFVPESIVWNRIAMQYRGRYINEVLGYKEYLPSGLSARTLRDTVKASRAYAVYFHELAASARPMPLAPRLRSYAMYTRSALHQQVGLRQQFLDAPSRRLWCLTAPVGVALYLRDQRALGTGKLLRLGTRRS
jgi:glycosyltransferase involved in cell wall biosynthesis